VCICVTGGGNCWQTLSVLECAMACSGVGLYDLKQRDGWVRLHSHTQGRKRTVNSHYFGAHTHPKYMCNTPANNFVQIQAGFTSDILVK